jgi:hypothetical protein
MVAIHSQVLGIWVVPEELAIDIYPGSMVCFSQSILDRAAEWYMGEFAGLDCELGFYSLEESAGFEVLNIK